MQKVCCYRCASIVQRLMIVQFKARETYLLIIGDILMCVNTCVFVYSQQSINDSTSAAVMVHATWYIYSVVHLIVI
jgi:predicted PP-loop superfamily ATPase